MPHKEAQRLSPTGEKAHRERSSHERPSLEQLEEERWRAEQGRVAALQQHKESHRERDPAHHAPPMPPSPYDNYKYPPGGPHALDRLEQAVSHAPHGYPPPPASTRAKPDVSPPISGAQKPVVPVYGMRRNSGSSEGDGMKPAEHPPRTLTAASLIDAIITNQINRSNDSAQTGPETSKPSSNILGLVLPPSVPTSTPSRSQPRSVTTSPDLPKTQQVAAPYKPHQKALSRYEAEMASSREEVSADVPMSPKHSPESEASSRSSTRTRSITLGEHIDSIIIQDYNHRKGGVPGDPNRQGLCHLNCHHLVVVIMNVKGILQSVRGSQYQLTYVYHIGCA